MKVLVTGCNGFIGRYICGNLMNQGYEVTGISLEDEPIQQVDGYIKADISGESLPEMIANKVEKADILIHTASKINMDNSDNSMIIANCVGANNVVKVANLLSCRKIINLSSLPIIGSPVKLPILEDAVIAPETLYHATKAMQEYIISLAESVGVTAINVRIPSPIGVGMDRRTILSVFIDNCIIGRPITLYGKGTRKQNYVDVRDIADMIEKCARSDSATGVYNIGSDMPVSNFDLAVMCKELLDSNTEITFIDKPDPADNLVWDVSTEKAKRELGWSAKYAIKDTIKWIADIRQ